MLRVSRGASEKEIRKAYIAQATLYHPDKVAHLGEDLLELARQRMLEINRAYEMLRSRRERW